MFPTRRIITSGGDVFRDEYSLAFDGTNDYIDCGTGLGVSLGDNYAGSLSVSIWFKAGTTSGNDGIFYLGAFTATNDYGEFMIRLDGDNLQFALDGIGWYRNYSFSDTTSWHHLVCIYDTSGEDASLMYVDGVSVGTKNGSFPADSAMDFAAMLTIIGAYGTQARPFHGNISDVAVYDIALSASQVATIYNGREPYNHKEGVASKSLVSWWRMGDGALDSFPILCDEVNPTKQDELSPNVSFDVNTTGWESYSSGDANTLSQETSITHSGAGSLKVVFGDSNAGWAARTSSEVTAVANKLIVFEGWVYIPTGSYDGGNPYIIDGGGFGGASVESIARADASIKDTWQFMRTISIPVSGDVSSSVYLYTTGTDPSENDILYWDDISIYVINGNAGFMYNMSLLSSYIPFEGDTP